MENVLAVIKSVSEDELLRTIDMVPDFLSPFKSCLDSDNVFVFKLNTTDNNCSTEERLNNNTDITEDTELTGTPLECPFSIHGDAEQSTLLIQIKPKEHDKYAPLSLCEARDILWHTSLQTDVSVPISLLTDGSDYKCTVLIGSQRKDDSNTRWWITVDKCDDITNLINQHITLSLISPMHLKSVVSCVYLIDEHTNNDNGPVTLLQESCGYIELHVSWKTPSLEVPLHEATTIMCINIEVGHISSDILQLWHEFIVLFDLFSLMKKWKTERIGYRPYARHNADFPNILQFQDDKTRLILSSTVSERLNELIKGNDRCSRKLFLASKTHQNQAKILSGVSRNVISNNDESEFTDKLWSLFIECSSYQDVSSFFETVFHSVMNGACKPHIKSTNISRLSQALRSCSKDSSDFIPVLEPIEMLIEIGIEKLKKNYRNIFLISKISSLEQLRIPNVPKFADTSGSKWENICTEWILWFMRVHTTLEMALLTESLIKSENCLVPITMEILNHYLSDNSPFKELIDPRTISNQQFDVPVNTRDVQNHLKSEKMFKSWTLNLCSKTSNRCVHSIYHRTMDEIFPSAVHQSIENGKTHTINCTNDLLTEYSYNFKMLQEQLRIS